MRAEETLLGCEDSHLAGGNQPVKTGPLVQSDTLSLNTSPDYSISLLISKHETDGKTGFVQLRASSGTLGWTEANQSGRALFGPIAQRWQPSVWRKEAICRRFIHEWIPHRLYAALGSFRFGPNESKEGDVTCLLNCACCAHS
jgi:hypothetical protein